MFNIVTGFNPTDVQERLLGDKDGGMGNRLALAFCDYELRINENDMHKIYRNTNLNLMIKSTIIGTDRNK